ncbi:MAG TPA: signal recognition particle-docking protein FtsY [bacterium]|nr:signal recognition particle-docking protein FtsY [bacterium]
MSKWVDRLKSSLAKTRDTLSARLDDAFGLSADPAFYAALEEALIAGDVGVATAERITMMIRQRRARDPAARRAAFRESIEEILGTPSALVLDPPPAAVLMLGVNGTGKTTTIGKLAHRLRAEGRSVLLAAGDTFRAAAIDQLQIWGQRVGSAVVAHAPGADPAAVVFDAIAAAKARGIGVLIIDTAGRLHTKVNLMEELKKINRVIGREMAGAPVERLLVLDASTGQNAIAQARIFHQAVEVTGIVLAKLDGSARGGVVLAIATELNIPVKLVGTGEGLDDLQPFDPHTFAEAISP